MKRCGLCGESTKAEALAEHMTRVHGWSSASPASGTSTRGRGCAVILFAVLVIYGFGNIAQAILPLSPGIRGNEALYVAVGLGLLLFAGAVWWLWLRRPSRARAAIPIEPPRRSILAGLLEHARTPDETSTDYLPWAWLIRLDLAFRDYLWVRIAVLVIGMIGVTLLVLLGFATGVLS